ncbi:hypothetical protein N7481_010241 [Penicillium waksmanii]|uniref:uncharacterized protein n=1 Tax=Penicillium waksmanii TaxID=69791 RepID=UPI002546CB52|nr:uncharacterized protein N7481_010241 [Penicillium waksmanii]KAJ5976534.1 hypothetical protein N7481_010241 [Penicillium waksmanii]
MGSILFLGNNDGLQVGYNLGSINEEFHLPPERPETPSSPFSNVPFPRDPYFVGRGTLLRQIRAKSSEPGSRIVLFGLGGVGKSQLAIEYSYRVRYESPTTWIFWIHASNKVRFEQSFRDIADQVKIPGRQDSKANIFKLVENWLRDEKKGKWICILDNADEDQFLCSPATAGNAAGNGDVTKEPTHASTKPLLEYIPRVQNGSVIITSRNREVSLQMVDHDDLVEVNPMKPSEALELLQKKLLQPEGNQESLQLVTMLEFMPLAIIQATHYIQNRAPRYSISQYLKDFQQSDWEAIKLLKEGANHLHRDWEAKTSIQVTWQMSFDRLRQIKPSAAQLLSLMSFFDRQEIPDILLRNRLKSTSSSELLHVHNDEKSESDKRLDFEDDIVTLKNYSLISVCENTASFSMHRLVQLTTLAWLKSHGQLDQWREKSISNMCEEFPTGQYENWGRCRILFPHIKSAMSQRLESSPEISQQWATLLYRGAWYASGNGNITDAKEMASESMKHRMNLFGTEDDQALESTAMLATAYVLEGLWRQAELLQLQVMKTRKAKLGEYHPRTLESLADLASTYLGQGRWKEAEHFYLQVTKSHRMKLGEDHSDTLRIVGSLAQTYQYQGRLKEAEWLSLQVIETRKTKVGENHPDTLRSIGNLVQIYLVQGRLEEAEQLSLQVIETRKIKLGENHPETLTGMGTLASIYLNQGRWEEAEQLSLQVIQTRKMKLSEEHPDTLTAMETLASIYLNQGLWEEAEQLSLQGGMGNLGLIYYNQGRWEEAEQISRQVMETRKTKLGEDHPDTLTNMYNLALIYSEQGRWEEAQQLVLQVIESNKTKRGEDHPDTLAIMHNLGLIYSKQGRWEEAEQLFLRVNNTLKIKLGEHHLSTLTGMRSLGLIYSKQGRWKEAKQLFLRLSETLKTKLGENHPETLATMSDIAANYMVPRRWKEAEELLAQVLDTQKRVLGIAHPKTLISMHSLALVLMYRGKNEAGAHMMAECALLCSRQLGPDHPTTVSSMSAISRIRELNDSIIWRIAFAAKRQFGERGLQFLIYCFFFVFTFISLDAMF